MKTTKTKTVPHSSSKTCRLPVTPAESETKRGPTHLYEITWRIFRIMAEFVEGFEFLSETSREVSIFGSTRFSSDNHWYKEAEKLGRLLGKNGYAVITGGGPGIMEAGNKGAIETGAVSIGINIQLPKEQRTNPYVTRSRAFHYFFTRKVMLAASSQVYVFFPGGFGTLDEFSEIFTLIQTGKMKKIPIVLIGKEFWGGLFEWVERVMIQKYKTLTTEEAKQVIIVDTAEEAFKIVSKSKERTIF